MIKDMISKIDNIHHENFISLFDHIIKNTFLLLCHSILGLQEANKGCLFINTINCATR